MSDPHRQDLPMVTFPNLVALIVRANWLKISLNTPHLTFLQLNSCELHVLSSVDVTHVTVLVIHGHIPDHTHPFPTTMSILLHPGTLCIIPFLQYLLITLQATPICPRWSSSLNFGSPIWPYVHAWLGVSTCSVYKTPMHWRTVGDSLVSDRKGAPFVPHYAAVWQCGPPIQRLHDNFKNYKLNLFKYIDPIPFRNRADENRLCVNSQVWTTIFGRCMDQQIISKLQGAKASQGGARGS
jgi:hypothetical protein